MKDNSGSKLTLALLILTLLSFSAAYNSYDYSNAAVTGDQLKNLIIDKQDKIIVTLWYKHIQNDQEHNKRNSIAESSLRRLISKCHADVIYTEADLSDYNKNEGTYDKIANELKIDLNELKHGPLVMVVYQQRGEMFWNTYDTMLIKLIQRVDIYIRKIENRDFGKEAPQCTVRLDYQELDEFYRNNPYGNSNGGSISSGSSGYGTSSGSGSSYSSGSGSSSSSGSGSSYNSISSSNKVSTSGSSGSTSGTYGSTSGSSGSTSGTSGSTSGTSGSTSGTSGSSSGTSGSTSGTSGSTSGTSGSTGGTSGSTSGTSGSTSGTSGSTSDTSGSTSSTSETSTETKPKMTLAEPSKAFMK